LVVAKGESQREVAEKFRMSRNTVKKIAESNNTEFKYGRRGKAFPVLGPHKFPAIKVAHFSTPIDSRHPIRAGMAPRVRNISGRQTADDDSAVRLNYGRGKR
jgi:hypothetical protein